MDEAAKLNRTSDMIIGAAIAVHRALGPGFLESAYRACLAFELRDRGLKVLEEVALPVIYRGVQLDCGYRLDLLVEDCIIVELKSVERLMAIHQAQVISYLRLSGHRLGLLINFNVKLLISGVKRVANNFPDRELAGA